MGSACRFLPTCSQYSILSYQKFGVWKGTVLTAWRLLRCQPWGGSGYDPPEWPPKGLGFLYGPGTWKYAPHMTVLLGSILAAYIAEELVKEILYII